MNSQVGRSQASRSVLASEPRDVEAVVFDTDGVITDSARVHAAAIDRVGRAPGFDNLLESRLTAGTSYGDGPSWTRSTATRPPNRPMS
ncbi:hypothetical protein [Streptomyces sp. NBC_00827]|uniref:hypothetical protein n=1 Tax=Streptomyces sp. NBC_00827 TaxID=2903677 RepID=UPI00386B4644|nr:hypothetical protein OG569_38105 [Streptomyces sp. NBC_00827]